jgi:hypothetical protein
MCDMEVGKSDNMIIANLAISNECTIISLKPKIDSIVTDILGRVQHLIIFLHPGGS